MRFLQGRGYRVIPVDPRRVGSELFGERIHASLADIGEPVDMVDIFRFRNAAAIGGVADEAVAIGAKVAIEIPACSGIDQARASAMKLR
jgi:uncharacterized protein